ncbi:MAG: hypothetical protein JNK05_03240 [Myxococcales bacterium]|nr:hypothetical protein [Myxococcales bacterium]
MLETINVYADNHLAPGLTRLALLALDTTLLALWFYCLVQLLLARSAARAANAAHDPATPLEEGARFVAGTVELARHERIAVRVTIKQVGVEHHGSKGSVNHRWTETSRDTEARPFYLRHASGARVRVEPANSQVLLVDALDQEHWTSTHTRQRRAVLSAGERAIVEGELVRGPDPEASGEGYRGSAAGWVLRPRDGAVNISAEDLGRRHTLRGRAFFKALFIVPVLGALALLPTLTAHARLVAGQDTLADYVQRATWTTRNNKGHVTHHYAARFALRDTGETHTIEVDRSDYESLPDSRGFNEEGPQTIWVRRVPSMPVALCLGAGATLSAWLLALSALGLGGVGYFVWKRHTYRRWYERTLVESHSGHLPEPSMRTFDER